MSVTVPAVRESPGRLAYAAVLGGTFVLGSVSLIYPFCRDHGIYGYLAHLALHGSTMYGDFLMGMPPLTVLVHALAFGLFGHTMTAIRILDLFWTAATAWLLFLFVFRAIGRRGLAVMAGLMYAFLYYQFDFWNTAQVDGFLNLPVVAAFLLVLCALRQAAGAREARLQWLAAGVFVGIAVFFKYPVGLLFPVFVLVALLRHRESRRWDFAAASRVAVGFVAVTAVVFLVLVFSGVLADFLEPWAKARMGYAQLGYQQEGILGRVVHMVDKYVLQPDTGPGALLGTLGFVFSIFAFAKRNPDRGPGIRMPTALVWMWLGCAVLSIFVQGKFFYYHYLPLLPPLAILSALALAVVFEPVRNRLERHWHRTALVAAVGVGLLACSIYPARFYDLVNVGLCTRNIRSYWGSARHMTRNFFLGEQILLADYLRKETASTDRVFIWGVDPLINFLARRGTVSRFVYNHPLVATWSWSGLREELMRSLRADPPEVFITEHDDETPWVMGHDLDSYEALMEFTELRSFVVDNYELEARLGRFDVLRRADTEQPALSDPADAELLSADLREALDYAVGLEPEDYRTVFWPQAEIPEVPMAWQREPRTWSVSYPLLNRLLWLEEREFTEFLPAVSIWIAGDERPFAYLEPFVFQNDGEHFVSEDNRFTLLHRCHNKLVLVYSVQPATGDEFLKGERWR